MQVLSQIILIACFVLSFSLNAAAMEAIEARAPLLSNIKDVDQLDLQTIADAKRFVEDLEQARKDGFKSTLHILGVFFLKDHKLQDGVFRSDIKKGIEYLTKSAKLGYGVSSSYLAIYFLTNNELEPALSQLRWTIVKADKTAMNIKYSATLQFASIVLDYFSKDTQKLQEAKEYLLISRSKKQSSMLSFLLANIFHVLGEEKNASHYLTEACTSKNINNKIENFCKNSVLIERIR